MPQHSIVLATRASPLAVAQSQWVADVLRNHAPELSVSLSKVVTTGDIILDRPLREVGGKGLFTTAVEKTLLAGEADVAVHSLKDMDSAAPAGLTIIAYPKREDPLDVLVRPQGADSHRALPADARIGTGGLRRVAQLRHLSPSYRCLPLRGNINSRLAKLDAGAFDAIMLAAAGLNRGGQASRIGGGRLGVDQMVPAPGQGILAVQIRADHPLATLLATALNDPKTERQALAERAFLATLGGNCHSPIGAHCVEQGDVTTLYAYLAPTALGENSALAWSPLLTQVWRGTIKVKTNASAQAFASAGRALARQAKVQAAHILQDWHKR